MKQRPYYIEALNGWMVVMAKSAREARSAGVWEFGRGYLKSVRRATQEEVVYYESIKGPLCSK